MDIMETRAGDGRAEEDEEKEGRSTSSSSGGGDLKDMMMK